jgi:hypothetical protein
MDAAQIQSLKNDPYVVYYLIGLAEREDRKVYRWSQWEKCFYLFDELLRPYAKSSKIECGLSRVIPLRPLKNDPPGTQRVTSKKVPLGRLRWSHEHNKKWSQRLDEPLPRGERIELHYFRALSRSPSSVAPIEVQIGINTHQCMPEGAWGVPGWAPKWDQLLTITVDMQTYSSRPEGYWANLVAQLTPLVRAVRIARTQRPWWLERPLTRGHALPDHLPKGVPVTEGHSLADANLIGRQDSLDLDTSWQKWEYLL